MFVVRNVINSLLIMVIVSVVLATIIITASFLWSTGSNGLLGSAIGTYTRVLLLLIVTRCLPMIPILIVIYLIGSYLVKSFKLSSFALVAVFSLLYIVLGLGLFGGNFWQLHNMYNDDFNLRTWFKSEQKDMFFSVSGLFGTIYFVWKSFYSNYAKQNRVT